MPIITLFALALGATSPADAPHYQARYDAQRGLYCLRIYKDAAMTRTGRIDRGPNCRPKTQWHRIGLTITHRRPAVRAD